MSTIQQNIKPIIDREKCCGDGLCADACVARLLSMDSENKAKFREISGNCIACGHCVAICPTKAIRFENTDIDTLASIKQDGKIDVSSEKLSHLIRMRRSIRRFKDEPIPLKDIEKALETSLYAPTAKNMQDVEWALLSDKNIIEEISLAVAEIFMKQEDEVMQYFGMQTQKGIQKGRNPVCYNAPHIVFAHTATPNIQNSTIAMSYLEILLVSMGIGTCWAGYIVRAAGLDSKINQILGLPLENKIIASLLIGYPAIKYQRAAPRKSLNLKIIE